MDDWRLNGQEAYLSEVKLKHISFSDRRDKNSDHEHCEFCWEKISEYPDTLSAAYCTEDEYHWVCETCFADFKEKFRWKI